jgi:FAD/FMN-containing dehydrogenase/Fe-S oxidoreductase
MAVATNRTTVTTPAAALKNELRQQVHGEVRFDRGSRALYAADASVYRQVPIGVVIPRDTDDVMAVVDVCRRFDAPILGRGCGTSLSGQCCNAAVILDFSKYMNRIIEIDPERRRARVQPGVILDSLKRAVEQYGLTFGPDPQTANHCTLGGMIGNNSCGVHSILAGKTEENVEELDILLYDGTRMKVGQTPEEKLESIVAAGGRVGETYAKLRALRDRYADLIRQKYPDIPRRVSGYNVPSLLPERTFDLAKALVGSEGTCALTLEATVRLVDSPPVRCLLVLAYPDVFSAGDHIPELMAFGPIGLEGFDDTLVEALKETGRELDTLASMPPGGGILLLEFGGETRDEADAKANKAMDALRKLPNAPEMKLFDRPHEESMIWNVRRDGLGATSLRPGAKHTWPAWDDAAVRPDRLGSYLRDFKKLVDKHGLHTCLYGHFGHGCVHTNIDFDLESEAGLRTYRAFMEEAADLVVTNGGSLTGEHGDGQARGELLSRMFGDELVRGFEEFKAIWDPNWKMNPGKVVRANRLDANLRLGASYHPRRLQTHFQFPTDDGNFNHALLRCVGAGECRTHHKGTMCPSFRVTREEKFSTRGRARLLFEMLEGAGGDGRPLRGGWRNKEVLEALDLCLACKGCKGDCPTQVDMATYKSEFLAHHYKGRLRPAHAYALGFIYRWSRLASLMPRMVNFSLRLPVIPSLGKRLAGITSKRPVPAFARQTFTKGYRKRAPRNQGKPQVLLWADTWNNYFLPDAAVAAVDVLEAAGFQVIIPERSLCCGRPLYDFGFLKTAKKQLRQILATLRPQIEAGIPIVGLEPSCVAVFRDEMINLFPNDKLASRMSRQTYTLGEFLTQKAGDVELPKLDNKVLLHGHCHQKALMGMSSEEQVLARMGADFETLDSGCCGLAGVFGFERDHYDTSIQIGELVLLPAVRQAEGDTLIVADGFSCREQILHNTDRKPMHLAQVIRLALQRNGKQDAEP